MRNSRCDMKCRMRSRGFAGRFRMLLVIERHAFRITEKARFRGFEHASRSADASGEPGTVVSSRSENVLLGFAGWETESHRHEV